MPPTISSTSCPETPGFSLEIVHIAKKQTQTLLSYKILNSLQYEVAQLYVPVQEKFCARKQTH